MHRLLLRPHLLVPPPPFPPRPPLSHTGPLRRNLRTVSCSTPLASLQTEMKCSSCRACSLRMRPRRWCRSCFAGCPHWRRATWRAPTSRRGGALRLLHINLRTRDGLAAALHAVPSLVHCGTLPVQSGSQAWAGARCKSCGPARHQLPEMMQLTCTPSSPKAHENLQRDVTELLASVQLQDCSWWFPSSHDPRRTGLSHLVINVVPRAALETDVCAAIHRIHDKVRLWGGLVRAHMPPTLPRSPAAATAMRWATLLVLALATRESQCACSSPPPAPTHPCSSFALCWARVRASLATEGT